MSEVFEPEVINISEARAKRSAMIYAFAGLLALVGLADSIYLTIEHMAGHDVRCTVTTAIITKGRYLFGLVGFLELIVRLVTSQSRTSG